jgi:predicted nucleic acid-binding protein
MRYLLDMDWVIHYLNAHQGIVGRLRAAGMLVGDLDLFIGVTAIHHDLTLLSNNRRHFDRIEGLRIESA